ncbi:hypothetical protein [Sulfurimonas sp.]
MECRKISSTLSRLSGDERLAEDALSFEGLKFRAGDVSGSNLEYMYNLKDLVTYAHLFVQSVTRDREVTKLAISIPTEAYYSSKLKEDGGLVRKMEGQLKRHIPSLKEVRVLPQGTSSLGYLVSKKLVDPKNGNVLIIDGGFNTLNISVVDSSGKIKYTQSIHDELGVFNLLNNFFREELKKSHDEVPTNAQMLKNIFLAGFVDGGFETINVEKEKKRAIDGFVPKLIDRVTRDLRKEKIPFEQFVFVGGISYYIPKDAIKTNKSFYIPKKDGEFLTVLGMRDIVGGDFDVFDVGFGDTKYILSDKQQEESDNE